MYECITKFIDYRYNDIDYRAYTKIANHSRTQFYGPH